MSRRTILIVFSLAASIIPFPASANDVASNVRLNLENFKKRECSHIDCHEIDQALNALSKTLPPRTKSPKIVVPTKSTSTPQPVTKPIAPLIALATPPFASYQPCRSDKKALFVTADSLDNFHFLLDVPPSDVTGAAGAATGSKTAADAKGASVNYTNNRIADQQTATIDGRVSYLVFGEHCDPIPAPGYILGDSRQPFVNSIAIAPFVASKGTWNEPLPAKLSNSVLQGGGDFQIGVSTLEFPLVYHYFRASPYYQTDYQQRAHIDGLALAWEPVAPNFYLDSGPVTPFFSFFWQLQAQADLIHVTDSGLTNLSVGDHAWLGETVRAHLGLFPPGQPIAWPEFVDDFVVGRLSLIGTAENYYDTATRARADYYSAALQYNIGACQKAADSGTGSTAACTISGGSSIAFEYDTGVDKDTLVKTRQYLVKLSYAY